MRSTPSEPLRHIDRMDLAPLTPQGLSRVLVGVAEAAQDSAHRRDLAKWLRRSGRWTGGMPRRMFSRAAARLPRPLTGRSLTTLAAFLCGAAGAVPFALESAPASASVPSAAPPAATLAAVPLIERLGSSGSSPAETAKAIPGWERERVAEPSKRPAQRALPSVAPAAPAVPAAPATQPRTAAEPDADSEVTIFNGRPVRAVRTITMRVTAYSPDERSCGDSADNITASGYSVWTNGGKLVAADSRVLPLGSLVSIPGYDGGAVVPVLDRGGAIKGNRLDVLFPSHEQARRWGVRDLKVTIYEYADGEPNGFRERHWVKPGQVAR